MCRLKYDSYLLESIINTDGFICTTVDYSTCVHVYRRTFRASVTHCYVYTVCTVHYLSYCTVRNTVIYVTRSE